jgi:type IV pilus assembly protein PilM
MAGANPIGLDIGSVSIRAVETARGKDGPVIINFGQVALPLGAVQGGVVHDDKAVTQALRHIWATSKFRGRDVVLGVSNAQIVVREMTVAKMPEREMRQSLPFQVRDMLPLPVDRSLLDFHALQESTEDDTIRGLLIAAPKDAVTSAVEAIERAGLRVARVDLASFALLRALSYLDGKVEALVDVGAQATTVVIHSNGEPLIVRTIPRGGAEITETIANRTGTTVAEAESLKCRVGLSGDEGPETADVIREAVRPLIGEIRNSFAYLTAGGRNTRVARLALSGGGALLPGLLDALGTQLDVEAVLPDPTMRLREPRRGGRHRFDHFRASVAVSIGLTLGVAS